MPPDVNDQIHAAVEGLRRKLIDTSRRNRLLNYRSSKTHGVDVVGEESASVFRLLVSEGKTMSFTGPPDPPRRAAEGEDSDLLTETGFFEPAAEARVVDTGDQKLNTAVTHTSLQNRLLHTWRQATAQLDEQGINTLFLALGMLEWKEADAAASATFAPLILVPVALTRTSTGGFRLKYDENEIGTNLSLQVAIDKQGVKLPDIPQDLSSFDVSAYFDSVRSVIRLKDGWNVHEDKIALGFFSYAKIVLYQDLDATRWPENQTPADHHDVKATLGGEYPSRDLTIETPLNLDEVRTPSTSLEIFEADSSQITAVMDALTGMSMVIEGPPGTGKSQTIANLVGEFVSQGKKVLFVSEKPAALEVVYRKLEGAGLGEACLEIHSQKANRRSFYEAIQATWRLRSRLPDASAELARLSELRSRLNGYVSAIHQPMPKQKVTPRFLIGKASTLPPVQEFNLDAGYTGHSFKDLSWAEVEAHLPDIGAIQAKVHQIGVPSKHPFYGSKLQYLGPDERLNIERQIKASRVAIAEAIEAIQSLSDKLGVSPPSTANQVATLRQCVDIAISAPSLDGVAVQTGTWQVEEPRIRAVLNDLTVLQELQALRQSQVLPTAWEQDLSSLKVAYDLHAEKLLKFLSGEFRRAQAQLQTILTPGTSRDPRFCRDLLTDLCRARECRQRVEAYSATGERLFGVQWQGVFSKPESLSHLLSWILDVERQVAGGQIPKSLLVLLSGDFDSTELAAEAQRVDDLVGRFISLVSSLDSSLRFDRITRIEDVDLAFLATQLETFEGSITRLSELVEWNILSSDLTDKGLGEVVAFACTWQHASHHLLSQVLRVWLQDGIKQAFEERPALRSFERHSHEEAIKEFKQLDTLLQLHNRARVSHAHLQGIPAPGAVGMSAELARQCNLRRGHRPIRWAYETSAELIMRIKPVAMMSPISVATFLPLIPNMFDVVIFDEASQIKPEDALSAIIRAKQAIVVGDTKQMPPTSFFDALVADDEYSDEDQYDVTVGKLESVLALFNAPAEIANRKADLCWHYRSLHESLIQPSNRLFYSDKLIVFPSPVYATNDPSSDLGLRFHYDPSATYDRGSAKKQNRKQAAAVADAIVAHMKARPSESLLAVAFSKHQQDAIEDELELRQRDDPGLFSSFNQLHQFEPLRVKNLETVQGDERDVVFISVGYGRDAEGNLSMNFGPINQEGGGRRLNVLMSRARKRCEVFTSIRGGDIRADSGKAGLYALKTFLEFAETGILDVPFETGAEPDSIFEEEVKRALEMHGYHVDPQVGTLGFRIDLAIRHPQKPGRYVIGIECDGATYHSGRSARDRDKLRQLVLEARGWRLHRIWSTDWWMDREACIQRCLAAIQSAIESVDVEDEITAQAETIEFPTASPLHLWEDSEAVRHEVGVPYTPWNRPFNLDGYHLADLPPEVMAKCVTTVVAFEGPIHKDLVLKRIRTSAGFKRAGNLIAAAVEEGVKRSIRNGDVVQRGDFLYWSQATTYYARNRSSMESADRLVEYIPPEELDLAIEQVLKRAIAADEAEICEGVKSVFGFTRTPTQLSAAVRSRLEAMSVAGRLTFNGQYRLAAD